MRNQQDVRVLVAEDNFLAGEMIKAILAEIGYTIVGKAVDGRQAVAMTQSARPDVVLMDIEMPDMDGIEATRLIQERRPTPVVVLTAYETEELVTRASQAGAGAYLIKPPNAREMQRAIMIALARFDDMVALRRSNRHLEDTLAELKATQAKMMQQERLAAVGQLAAGIAHEFNNIMAAIILYADIILRTADLTPKVRQKLNVIQERGRHAADLTQQILDFGRESVLRRQGLDLVSFMEALRSQLERALPANIQLRLSHSDEEIWVHVDPGRLQQAIINLALNARDAMPDGGELRIGLERVLVGEGQVERLPEMPAGEWAQVTVSDSGAGIAPDALPHIFEPFFTTRAPLGSGLGLSQVYGIVKQHDGHIDVTTKAGEGTTFTLFLPVMPTQT